MDTPKTLFEKLFSSHVIQDLGDNNYLMLVDRCLLHELGGEPIFEQMNRETLTPFSRDFIFAVTDHTVSAQPGRTADTTTVGQRFLPKLVDGCRKYSIPLFGLEHPDLGIVHVIAPQQGIVQPGMTCVCGDSHTCTNGAMAALAWGAGSSVIAHVIATHSVIVQKPKTMRVNITGSVPPDVCAMDIVLHIISTLGTAYGVGYAIEWAGSVIDDMSMEDRFTVCNLTVEFGSEYGIMAADQKTMDYFLSTPGAPTGQEKAAFLDYCQNLHSDPGAQFDKEVTIDISSITPQISWGTTPSYSTSVHGSVPLSYEQAIPADQSRFETSLVYMGLQPGEKLEGLKVDKVFIGSCTNGRIENLRQAAKVAAGRKVAPWVEAWVVPGSQKVRRQAEEEGLADIFRSAGFVWGEPCCAYCSGANGVIFSPQERCVSTTNRNFMHRQGPGARTHLASPATAAACAVSGHITCAPQLS